MPLNPESVIIVGGHGAVGQLFCSLLRKKCKKLAVMDIRSPSERLSNVEYIRGDITDEASLEQWQDFDVVILSVPEDIAIRFIDLAGRHQIEKKCFIDTLSVKSVIVDHWRALTSHNEVLSINPMFGPSLGFKGQSVGYIDVKTGPNSKWFLNLMKEAHCDLVRFDAQSHDRVTAATQAVTHAAILAFGLTLKKMGYDSGGAKSIWTPLHKTMLAMLARMLSADPEVYRDIQCSNPFAGEARTLMLESMQDLDRLIASNDAEQFAQTFDELDVLLGETKEDMANLCGRLFSDL